jgi:formiminotetrahydrofolate cyclodeaminase
MEGSIWTATLASFRDRLASAEPAPAGVSAAAVSATFGLGLLTKVLEIASKRKDFAGDRELVRSLFNDARSQSLTLSRLADEDIAAFDEYLDCLRRKQPTDAAIRRAIEVPLNVARAAASGLDLCEKAAGLVHAFVASDLGAASSLLHAAVLATLMTVDFNVQQLPEGDPYRGEVTSEILRLAAKSERRSPADIADERL